MPQDKFWASRLLKQRSAIPQQEEDKDVMSDEQRAQSHNYNHRIHHNHNRHRSRRAKQQHEEEHSIFSDIELSVDEELDLTNLVNNPRPARIDSPLYILLLEGKTKKDRERSARLMCASDPDAIKGALMTALEREGIELHLNCFRFAVQTTKNKPAQSIYQYQLNHPTLSHVDWSDIARFELIQTQSPRLPANPSNFTVDANTEYLSHNQDAAKQAANDLANMFKDEQEVYNKLRGQTKVYLMAKKDLMNGVCTENVKQYVYNALRADAHVERPQVTATKQSNNMANKLDALLDIILVQTALNISAQSNYGAVHGQSQRVEQQRWNPLHAQLQQHLPSLLRPNLMQNLMDNVQGSNSQHSNSREPDRQQRRNQDKEEAD